MHKLINKILNINVRETEMHGVTTYNTKEFKKILRILNKWNFNDENDIRKLYIFDDNDLVVTKLNYDFACEQINVNTRVCKIDFGGHFGTKQGWELVVEEIKAFINNV